MILLLRVFLIGLIIYLLVRSFFIYGKEQNDQGQDKGNPQKNKKISKDVGEFIDYEEIKK